MDIDEHMIVIYASELAACVGMNRYRPVSDVARKIWCRSDPEGYRKALLRNETSDLEPVAETLNKLKLTGMVDTIVDHSTPESISKEIQTFTRDYQADLTSQGILLSDLTSYVLTQRGKNSEEGSLVRLEKALNVKIGNRNHKFYKRVIPYEENEDGTVRKFMLGGKVDGITEDGHLVEVKNRQYRIFSELPVYEKVQIHAYMFLTGILDCKYVQSFKGHDEQEMVEFEQDFWDTIKNKCCKFVKSLEMVMRNERLQDQLLSLGKFSDADDDDDGDDGDDGCQGH